MLTGNRGRCVAGCQTLLFVQEVNLKAYAQVIMTQIILHIWLPTMLFWNGYSEPLLGTGVVLQYCRVCCRTSWVKTRHCVVVLCVHCMPGCNCTQLMMTALLACWDELLGESPRPELVPMLPMLLMWVLLYHRPLVFCVSEFHTLRCMWIDMRIKLINNKNNKIAFWSKADHPQMYAFKLYVVTSVTWQRCQSHHLICHSRKPHATCKPYGSMFYRSRLMADQSFTLRQYAYVFRVKSHFAWRKSATKFLCENRQWQSCKAFAH